MSDRHTILVVDDEPDVVRSVQDLLRLEYRVLGATRAADGLRILGQEKIDVIMTDQRMPGMTGVEFLCRCRSDNPDAIRLLLTGYADIRDVIDSINRGSVYRYIAKPWDPEELTSIVREAVERHELIEERKRLVEELKQQNEALEASYAELKKAEELHSAFVQVASHELRTPLSILLGLTHLATTSLDDELLLPDCLNRIGHAAGRLGRLVDQLIDMLAVGRFDPVLDARDVDLVRLIEAAVDDVRPFTTMRRQTIKLDLPLVRRVVCLDELRIRSSLNHLLMNAVKFTPDEGRLGVIAAETEDSVLISIQDSGSGVPPEDLPRIFDPFFTGFNVSNHSSGQFEFGSKGIGLGLSVVKAFVEMHGGKVSAESRLGHGTTITVRLPARGCNGRSH